MNNQTYQKQIVEIDLKKLCWDILSQWKAVLVLSIIIAILVCGAKYSKDIVAYNDALRAQKEAEEQKTLSQDERISNIIDSLPDSDIEKVRYIVQEKRWIAKQKAYFKKSVLMQTDPTNQRELDIVYRIIADNAEDLPMLVQSYSTSAGNENLIDAVKPLVDPQADSKYIGELFINDENDGSEIVSGNGAAITIRIVLPEETDAAAVEKVITDALVKQGKNKLQNFPHTIQLAESEVKRIYNDQMIDNRENSFNNINKMEDSIKTAESSLTEEQKAALGAISAILEEEESVNSQETLTDTADDIETEKLTPPGFSKRYAFLGFALGVFMYAFCYVTYVIIKGCVSSASGIEAYTKSRLLGEAYFRGDRKGMSSLLHSDLVDKLRYKGLPDFSTQIEKIEESLEAVCAHADAKDITMIKLTDSDNNSSVKEALVSVSDSIKKSGINSDTIDAHVEFDEKQLLPVKAAALILSDDTKLSRLGKVMSLCRDYDINILGSIYISEM